MTVITASSPGRYELLSNATFTSASFVESPPTRTETAAASSPVNAIADDFVPTVIDAVPTATPVRSTR